MSSPTPWSSRFDTGVSDSALKRALRIEVVPVTNLASMSPNQAAAHLRAALQSAFVPTTQILRVIRHLTEVAKAYCEIAYPDSVSVLRRIYHPEEQFGRASFTATCLMGLAGTGKSAILAAFARMHPTRVRASVPNHSELELQACWSLRLHDRATIKDLLLPRFRAQPQKMLPKDVPLNAVSELAAQGVSLILADEFQFVTGSDANVMVTKLLLRLAELGPPLIFACNYSLVHRLWKRPSQERDRLLVRPIVIQPEPMDDDWFATVSEFTRVAPEFATLNAEQVSESLHSYSFGIKRSLTELLVLAYLEMRQNGDPHVTQAHITRAYTSTGYASMRSDIEHLLAGAISPSRLERDFRPPFSMPIEVPSRGRAIPHPAVSEYESRIAQAALDSLTSPAAKEVLELLGNQPKEDRRTRSRPTRPAATVQNLIGGAERFAKGETDDTK